LALFAVIGGIWGLGGKDGAFVLLRSAEETKKDAHAHAHAATSRPLPPQKKNTQVADPNNLDTFQYDVQQKYNR
jgi:hypothetical protein